MRSLSDDGLNTIAYTMLGEAANQGTNGLAAVANVIKNRSLSGSYSSDPVHVALQPSQFSAWNPVGRGGNDPVGRYSQGSRAFQQAKEIARKVFNGDYADNTGGALWYHTGAVNPKWDDNMHVSARIGAHIFYTQKPPTSYSDGNVRQVAPSPMSLASRPNVSAIGYAAAPEALTRNAAVTAIKEATSDTSKPPSATAASIAMAMRGGFQPLAYADTGVPKSLVVTDPTELRTAAGAVATGGQRFAVPDVRNVVSDGISGLIGLLGGKPAQKPVPLAPLPKDKAVPVGADPATGLIGPDSLVPDPGPAPAVKDIGLSSMIGGFLNSALGGSGLQGIKDNAMRAVTGAMLNSTVLRTAVLDPMIYGYKSPGTADNHPASSFGYTTPRVAAAVQAGNAGQTFKAGQFSYRINNDGTTTNMTTGHTYGGSGGNSSGDSGPPRSLVG